MHYVWVVLDYSCPNGHRNKLNKYYSSSSPITEEVLHPRLPRALPCYSCHADSISLPRAPEGAHVEVRAIGLTEVQFAELDTEAESLDAP
jgi:hypothetical protein